jgi:hypothetical protein
MQREKYKIPICNERYKKDVIDMFSKFGEQVMDGSVFCNKSITYPSYLIYGGGSWFLVDKSKRESIPTHKLPNYLWVFNNTSTIGNGENETIITHEFPQGGGVVVSDKNPQKALELLMLGVDAGTLINILKDKAEELGYNLVEKPYEPKIGDFGVAWDGDDEGNGYYGFITEMDRTSTPYKINGYDWWQNFRKLTEEEKTKIQENW